MQFRVVLTGKLHMRDACSKVGAYATFGILKGEKRFLERWELLPCCGRGLAKLSGQPIATQIAAVKLLYKIQREHCC